MNKSQRAWICFPWHGLRLNSRSLHPDIRLSFSLNRSERKRAQNMGTQIHRRISLFCLVISLFSLPLSLSVSLLFCSRVLPVALLVQVKDFSSPSPSLFVPREWERERIREGKIKRECLRTQRAVYPSQEVWERGRKKHTSLEEGGGEDSIVPSFLTLCVCVHACVCMCVCRLMCDGERNWMPKQSVYSDRKKANTLRPHPRTQYTHTHTHTHRHTHTHTHTHTLLSLCHTHIHTHTFCSLSVIHTHTHTHRHTHTHTLVHTTI